MQHWLPLAGAILLGLATVLLALALVRTRRAAHEELARARSETEQLRERVQGIEARLTPHPDVAATTEYVITDLGQTGQGLGSEPDGSDTLPAVPGRIDGRLFADLVLRETVVKGASLAHGVRRALEPENRFRMRYTFRREVKRSRKRRRAELREARRLLARRRAGGREDVA